MRAKLILYFHNSRVYGGDLASKTELSPTVASATVRSKAVGLLLLLPWFVGV